MPGSVSDMASPCWRAAGRDCMLKRKRIGATHGAAPMKRMCARSVRQRIGPHLDVYRARLGALAAFLQPRRAVSVRAPQSAALPAGVRVVDAAVQALGKET